jgi:hypothetical protein
MLLPTYDRFTSVIDTGRVLDTQEIIIPMDVLVEKVGSNKLKPVEKWVL